MYLASFGNFAKYCRIPEWLCSVHPYPRRSLRGRKSCRRATRPQGHFSAMPNRSAARKPFAKPQGHFSAMPRSGFAFALSFFTPPRLSLRGGVRMARRSLFRFATDVPCGRGCLMRAPRPPRLPRKSQSPYSPRSFGFVSSFGCVWRVLFSLRRATSRRCRNRSAARRPFAKPQGHFSAMPRSGFAFAFRLRRPSSRGHRRVHPLSSNMVARLRRDCGAAW